MLAMVFLLFGFAYLCFGQTIADGDCGIQGKWKNELNSTVEFICRTGTLIGKYRSAVGQAKDFYRLLGRYTMAGPGQKDCILGFSVAWNNTQHGNSNSTTSWTGVYFAKEEVINTKWILTMDTAPEAQWRNSLIGMDTFVRIRNGHEAGHESLGYTGYDDIYNDL